MKINVNDIEMYYEIHGAGPPLVLLHGGFLSGRHWESYIERLAAHFRLIIPDFRGHGRSTNPSGDFAHAKSAADILALLDALEIDQFSAIGFSYGGVVLLIMATEQPDRVQKMILIGTPPSWPEKTQARLKEMSLDHPFWQQDWLRFHHATEAQIMAIAAWFHKSSAVAAGTSVVDKPLAIVAAETLIIHGDRDGWFPPSAAVELYNAIPHAYLWVLPNAHHFPIGVRDYAVGFLDHALEFLADDWQDILT